MKRALLIEDDKLDSMAIERALNFSDISFECDHVNLMSDAKSKIESQDYDLVITDMRLPDSDGLETVNTLLKLERKMPIVVLSGTEDDGVALESVNAGAQDFIPKKYIEDYRLINRTLHHAMERHQLKVGLEMTRDQKSFLAHYDQNTGLPNRLLFLDRISQAVVLAKRNQQKFALLFIDLDRFKSINDTIGHAAGDAVLRDVGERMSSLVRESDTVARFGGDEFVILFQNVENNQNVCRLGERLIESIGEPIYYGQHQCSVGASIGIACYPRHGHSPDLLLKNADIAMYESKKNGRNQLRFFSQELFEQRTDSLNVEKALKKALCEPDKNFELHYQPRVEFTTGKVRSVEALIRWHHKELGQVPPDKFISLAEEIGLIRQIDEWVFEEACRKLQRWQEEEIDVQIGINISGLSFDREDFVDALVKPMLEKYKVPGERLELEITERILLSDTVKISNRLNDLKALGIGLAIDDFGTGFSSLSYLSKFPIDTIKIDGSFICDEKGSHSEQTLLKAIVALGKTLDMKVVAECIENVDQKKFLESLTCHEGQGYFWGKPDSDWMPE